MQVSPFPHILTLCMNSSEASHKYKYIKIGENREEVSIINSYVNKHKVCSNLIAYKMKI